MIIFGFAALFALSVAGVFRLAYLRCPSRYSVAYLALSGALIGGGISVFALIVSEILQAGSGDDRALLWRLAAAFMLVLVGVIAPFVQIARFVARRTPPALRWLAVPVFLVYLVAFRLASRQLPIERYIGGSQPTDPASPWFELRQDSLACISFVGITTMAVLCGVSSVSAPYAAFFADSEPCSLQDVDRLRASLAGVNDMLSAKELEARRLRLDIACGRLGGNAGGNKSAYNGNGSGNPSPSGSTFSLSRLVGLVSKEDARERQLRSLSIETGALESLQAELSADLASAEQKLAQQDFARTAQGRVHRMVFSIFAIYCIYRVGNSYLRMGWWLVASQPHEDPKGGPRDALVAALAHAINRLCPDVGVDSWSRIIGAFMSGAVLVAALNGVLQTWFRVTKMFHAHPSASASSITPSAANTSVAGAAPNLDPLLVGQVLGVYVLSIANTLRFNLPRNMSGAIMSALVAPLKVSSIQLWNDVVLCITSSLTLVVILAMNRLGTEPIYDAEMGDVKHAY